LTILRDLREEMKKHFPDGRILLQFALWKWSGAPLGGDHQEDEVEVAPAVETPPEVGRRRRFIAVDEQTGLNAAALRFGNTQTKDWRNAVADCVLR
jgi:hypothetical protein